MKVGYDNEASKQYSLDVQAKVKAFNEALTYAGEFIEISDLTLFSSNMIETFKQSFKVKHESSFPPLVKQDKQFELVGFSLHKLESLELRYKALNVEIDTETLTAINIPNFDIVLTTEGSISRYKAVKKALDSLEALKAYNLTIYPALAQQLLNNSATYNFSTNQLEVNLSWCNGLMR